MKASQLVLKLLLFTVLGLGLYQIGSGLFPLLPKLAWLSVALGIVAIVELFTIHLLGRFHERAVRELSGVHASDIERLKLAHQDELGRNHQDLWKGINALTEQHRVTTSELNDTIENLKAENESLKKQRPKLIFDVDTQKTRVKAEKGSFGCYVLARIRMSFDNSDLDPLTVKDLRLTLHERDDEGATRTIEAELLANHVFHPDDDLGALNRGGFKPRSIEGRNPPAAYWFIAELSIEAFELSDFTERKPFLRMTMKAQNQLPFVVDMEADWTRGIIGFTRVFISDG